MGDYFSQRGFAEPSAAQLHTMQRHRDILQDYLHEFTKTKVSNFMGFKKLFVTK